jgi:ribosomal protein L11 methyltransferase
MNFIAITIYTTHEGIEPVTGRLYTLGIGGVEIEDKADFDEFLAMNMPNWDDVDENLQKQFSEETRVKAYVADNSSGNETVQYIKESMNQLKSLDGTNAFGRLEIALAGVSEEDWANNWKQYYKPTRIGRQVVIVPEWEDYKAEAGTTVVRMNPGAAFGTGTHETTRLCIEFVEEFVTGKTATSDVETSDIAMSDIEMLDIGTGSGILAVTALMLGAKSALGIDIDELAAKVALENAQLNGIEGRFSSRRGNLADDVPGRYNLITANIVADVILLLAPDIPAHLAPGGVFVASGIIAPREEEVREKLKACGLTVFAAKNEKNWVALACRQQA